MSKRDQAIDTEQTKINLKKCYLDIIVREAEKLSEEDEAFLCVKEHAETLASAYAHSMCLAIVEAHDRQMNQIKRESAKWRMIGCPLIALFFGLIAWGCFSQGLIVNGILYSVGALVFIAMLVLGAIFDRPR
jgi:hypothetical protein